MFRVVLFLLVLVKLSSSTETCQQVGECVPCSKDEKDEYYCLEFGHRSQYLCTQTEQEAPHHFVNSKKAEGKSKSIGKSFEPRQLQKNFNHSPEDQLPSEPKTMMKFVGCVPSPTPSIHFFLFELSSLVLFLISFNAVASRKKLLADLYQRRIQTMVEV
jgi:hypothetical protein